MKGRNSNLVQLRNQYLIKRYYYWYELERMRIDDVLIQLSTKEVFLDETYILTILRTHQHLLKELKHNKVSARNLTAYEFRNRNSDYQSGTLFSFSDNNLVAAAI